MFLNVLPSATPPHILDGFFSCLFSEMPNSALAFGRSCAAGKGETSVASSTFFYQIQRGVNGRWYHLSFVGNGGRERERGAGGGRKRGTCKGIHEKERGAMKTCEETHELCSIMIQRVWPLRYFILPNGGYSLPRTMRGGCRIVASFFFLGRSCAGGGGHAAILFLLFSFPPCKVVFSVSNQYAEC